MFKRSSKRRDEQRALTVENVPAIMLGRSEAGVAVTPRAAMSVADAYACIRALADAAAMCPLKVYRRTGSGRERIEGGTAELLEHPADAISQPVLVAQMVAHLNTFGECFLGKFRQPDGEVFQLGCLAPDRVTVEQKGGMRLFGYADDEGHFGTYTSRDVIQIMGMTWDGLRGVSPVRQAREALGYATALSAYGSRYISQGARPSGILSVPPSQGQDETLESLREAFETRHGGVVGAGRIAILSAEVGFQPLSLPLQDSEFLGQREFSTREVARIFRVPSWIINGSAADSMTYSNTAEQARAFVVFSLGPWLRFIEAALTADRDLFGEREYVAFDLDGLLRADPQTRAAVYTAALNETTGWLDRSEVRAFEDLPAEVTNAT